MKITIRTYKNEQGKIEQVVADSRQDIGFALMKEWELIREESFERPEVVEEKKPREYWIRFAPGESPKVYRGKPYPEDAEPKSLVTIVHVVEQSPNHKMLSRKDIEKAWDDTWSYREKSLNPSVQESPRLREICKALGFEEKK